MTLQPSICSRCLFAREPDSSARFCPRCGLPIDNEQDDQPLQLKLPDSRVTVRRRLAIGDLCNLYFCDVDARRRTGVLKIARWPQANPYMSREAETLRRLHQSDAERRFTPFLPEVVESARYTQSPQEEPRTFNLLVYHEGIENPDELYSLQQVHAAYPGGIDARDMAWMWRRVLTALHFVHQQHLGHGALTPDHILIEPREHKLVLIGWNAAAPFGMRPYLLPARWRQWHNANPVSGAAHDLGMAGRSMASLLGADVDPAISRHLERAAEARDAAKLLEDFDNMIEVLWGPRQFRPFYMPKNF